MDKTISSVFTDEPQTFTQQSLAMSELVAMNTTETGELTNNVINNSKIIIIPVDLFYWSMHIIALVVLVISAICSILVLVWQQRTATQKNVFRRKIGERLVVYLAVTDCIFSISHFCDHLLIIYANGYRPPVSPCIVFAAILGETCFAQSFLIVATALSLCLLVAFNRKINFGRYDMGLFFAVYILPFAIIIWALAKDYLGYHGFWCFMNIFNPAAIELMVVQGFLQTITFFANVILYGIVWLAIIQSARRLKKFEEPKTSDGADAKGIAAERQSSNTKTAKILTLFGAAYLAQWWPAIVSGMWAFVEPIPFPFLMTYVIFHNGGGVFNMLAYTYVRKWSGTSTKEAHKRKPTQHEVKPTPPPIK